MNKILLTLLVTCVAICIVILVIAIGEKNSETRKISLDNISAKVSASADILDVRLMITGTSEESFSDAEAKMSATRNTLFDKLQSYGIKKEDIVSENFVNYESERIDRDGDDEKRVKTYTVNQSILAHIHDASFHSVDSILSYLSTLGAVQVQNVSKNIENIDALYQDARMKAIEKAKQEAEAIAQKAGVKLGKVLQISFSDQSSSIPPVRYFGAKTTIPRDSLSNSWEDGEDEYTATVSVQYEIR